MIKKFALTLLAVLYISVGYCKEVEIFRKKSSCRENPTEISARLIYNNNVITFNLQFHRFDIHEQLSIDASGKEIGTLVHFYMELGKRMSDVVLFSLENNLEVCDRTLNIEGPFLNTTIYSTGKEKPIAYSKTNEKLVSYLKREGNDRSMLQILYTIPDILSPGKNVSFTAAMSTNDYLDFVQAISPENLQKALTKLAQ